MIIKVGEGKYFDTAAVTSFAFDQKGYLGATQVFLGQDGWQVGTTALTRGDYCLMLADIENALNNGLKFWDISCYPLYHDPNGVPAPRKELPPTSTAPIRGSFGRKPE